MSSDNTNNLVNKPIAIVIGATGLVGRHLLDLLIKSQHYQHIYQVVRRHPSEHFNNTGHSASSVKTLVVPDFSQLEQVLTDLDLTRADAFCTLGTTLKQAGSKAAFKQVDLDYSLDFARIVKAAGADHFLLLTATGAKADSAFFYNQVKGQLQDKVSQLGFNRLSIFQPSLLLGQHKDSRLLEGLAQQAFGFGKKLLPQTWQYRPIEAERVAKAMQHIATHTPVNNGTTIYSNSDLLNLTLENPA